MLRIVLKGIGKKLKQDTLSFNSNTKLISDEPLKQSLNQKALQTTLKSKDKINKPRNFSSFKDKLQIQNFTSGTAKVIKETIYQQKRFESSSSNSSSSSSSSSSSGSSNAGGM
jgi:hypothetical protein